MVSMVVVFSLAPFGREREIGREKATNAPRLSRKRGKKWRRKSLLGGLEESERKRMLLHLALLAARRSRTSQASTRAIPMRATRPFSAALGWGSGKGNGGGSQRAGDGERRRRPNPNEGGGGSGGGSSSDRRRTFEPRRSPPPPPPPPPPSRPPAPHPSISSSSSSSSHAFDHTGRFFATCHPGLEPFVAEELLSAAVGASGVEQGRGGVHFRGSAATCYAANLWLRTAIRVLHLVGEGSIAPSRYRGGNGNFSGGNGGNGSNGNGGGGGRAGSERGGDRLYALTRRAVDCEWEFWLFGRLLEKKTRRRRSEKKQTHFFLSFEF